MSFHAGKRDFLPRDYFICDFLPYSRDFLPYNLLFSESMYRIRVRVSGYIIGLYCHGHKFIIIHARQSPENFSFYGLQNTNFRLKEYLKHK